MGEQGGGVQTDQGGVLLNFAEITQAAEMLEQVNKVDRHDRLIIQFQRKFGKSE